MPCWWDNKVCWYEHVTQDEFNNYRLRPLAKITSKIAEISRMQWFSSEIAIDSRFDRRRFVAIDYVNDQCDMTAQSRDKTGVPDSVVECIAFFIVKAAYRLIHKQQISKDYTIWLRDGIDVHIRGLSEAPEPLTQSY